MSSLAIMRGTRNEINNAPIVNGQVFIETDQVGTNYNKIYIDNNNIRTKLGLDNWNDIINKPFDTVGNTLSISNGNLSIKTDWSDVSSKPFENLGYGISVDDNNDLVANINQLSYGINSNDTYISINNNHTIIHGSRTMELSKPLSQTEDNIYTFEGSSDFPITDYIKVYNSVFGFYPKRIKVKNNVCKVTFPPYPTPNTTMFCRIYIL